MARFLPEILNVCEKLPNRSPVTVSPPGFLRTHVLPPITCASDKRLIASIQAYIMAETEKLESAGQLDAEQQYIIHGHAFDKVIDHCTDYKCILAAIKQEYDEFIDIIKKSQSDAIHLQGKLKALASEPTTLMYYRKRAKELTDRIELIKKDSLKIENQLKERQGEKTPIVEESGAPEREINPARLIPGMTMEDSFSMEHLVKHQQYLEQKLQMLKEDKKKKYVPVQKKREFEDKLSLVLQNRDKVELINKDLMVSYRKRRLLADTILSWMRSDKSVTLYDNISQVIAKENELKDDVVPTDEFDLDPRKISEAESMLEYIERFNELFADGQYKAAAIHAANSPKGILRNTETMERFKGAVGREEDVSPLLLFFEELIGSSYLTKHPINAALTLEGIKCALSYNKLELVVHWVTQQRVTFSEALGDIISDYSQKDPHHNATCLALAQLIFRKCACIRKAALCMCLQGQVQGALDYTYQCKQFSLDDYLFLLKNCPNSELIHGLTKERNGKPAALSVGQAVLSLIYTDHKEYGFQLLESIHSCGEGSLEQVILNDVGCTPEGWVEIADECLNNNSKYLYDKIMSIVTSQDGVVEISSKDEDAKIMEHVFM
ncbi:clathrin heavy chain linker domain-containing protein 1 [Rhinophrynus dorsalis]